MQTAFVQKELWAAALAGLALLGGSAIPRPVNGAPRYDLEEKDTVKQTLRLAAGAAREVEISNLSGPVAVTAGGGDAIDVVVERTLQAEDASAMSEAKRVSQPSMSESPRGVQVLAAGTQRGACDAERDRRDGRRWSDPPYRVQARVEVRVPANVTLRLCTVNGPASVTGVAGGVHVSAVNGPITASEIGGDVRLKTVNGNIDADVRARPGRPWDLATVNGNVLLRMPTDAAADLRLKTMHGGIYTDFETTELPATAPTVEQRGNLRVLRSNRSVGVRIGAGGPTVTIETVNGNVRVQRR